MIEVEMWAIKDVEKDELIMTKFGRSLWKRKQSPNNVNVIGYRHWEKGNGMLQPVKVRITELVND